MLQYPVVPSGRDARVRRQDPFEHGSLVRPIRRKPHDGPSGDDLYDGAGFVEQRTRLDRTLSSTDDHDPLALEPTEVIVIAGMRDQSGRQTAVQLRSMG